MILPSFAKSLNASGAALVLVVAIGCATGARSTPPRKQRTVETLPDGSQVVCELERPTGSHIAESVCHTYSADDVQRMKNQMVTPRSAADVKAPGT